MAVGPEATAAFRAPPRAPGASVIRQAAISCGEEDPIGCVDGVGVLVQGEPHPGRPGCDDRPRELLADGRQEPVEAQDHLARAGLLATPDERDCEEGPVRRGLASGADALGHRDRLLVVLDRLAHAAAARFVQAQAGERTCAFDRRRLGWDQQEAASGSVTLAQIAEQHHTINGYSLRVRELEGALKALEDITEDYEKKTVQLERAMREIDRHCLENDQLRNANHETHEALERARVEIARLNGLLDMIYRSKTWKLHTMMEKMRGR